MGEQSQARGEAWTPDLAELCRQLIASSPLPMAALEGAAQIVRYVNPAFCRHMAKKSEELIGIPLGKALPEAAFCLPHLDRVYRTGQPEDCTEDRVQGQQNRSYAIWPVLGAESRVLGVMIQVMIEAENAVFRQQVAEQLMISAVRQNEELARNEKTLREREEQYRTLFESIDEGYCVLEMRIEPDKPLDYRFIEINQAFEKQSTLVDAKGKWMRELRPEHEESWFEIYRDVALTGKPVRFELSGKAMGGRLFTLYAFRLGNPEQRRVAVLFNDITERKRLDEEIRHMAHHDAMTGLPNRRLFMDLLTLEMAQARRNRKKLAVLFLDLDRFKEINDTLGHETGDELLKQVAARLKASVRVSDTIARIGGDEFNVIIPDIYYPEYASEVAQKIMNEIRRPFTVHGHELTVSTSIGISIFPDDSEEIDTLLRYADIAMYHAKERGRNTYQFYNPVINTRSLERMKFQNSLRQAIARSEFRLYYQPLVDVKTRKIVSAEVLLRWQHPESGLLMPGQFLNAAEDIGLMMDIDEWVLKAAGKQISSWIDEGVSPICITVNLSSRQFQNPYLGARISQILEETGLPPECIDIEIPESVAMGNIDNTISRIGELTKMGVHASIDDFGTGYSSLSQLKRLPIQKLKIDKSFVRDIETSSNDRAIVKAVLLMAHSMNLRVVAEGVENEDQLAFLREQQCDEAQGFLFSGPLSADKFRELATTRK